MSSSNKPVKIVFGCLDWRLHPRFENYFCKKGITVDLCVTAGSLKGLIDPATQDFFLKQIEISKNLHHCQEIVLTMHMDCGAYGGSAAFGNIDEEIACYEKELWRAKEIIGQKFPDLPVKTWLIGLDKNNDEWEISPKEINID